MAILFHSAITTATDGTSMRMNGRAKDFGVSIVYTTAAPTAAVVTLQGSNDNSNWFDLGNTNDISAVSVGFQVADKPHKYIRANLTSYTAGSCTGVTIKVQPHMVGGDN